MIKNKNWYTKLILFLIPLFFIIAPTRVSCLGADTQNSEPKSAIAAGASTEQNEQAPIYLNFENATLSSVVTFLMQQKKINFIPNKNLESIKVSLSTKDPFTLGQAWDLMTTLLESNQFALVNINDVYQIIQTSVAKQKPLPIYMQEAHTLPNNDMMIRYVYLFKNIRPDNIRGVLDQILTPGSVQYNNNLNVCLMTEKSNSIKTAMKIVQELDSGGLRESIKIIHLAQANAEQAAEFINKNLIANQDQNALRFIPVQGRSESSYFSKKIKVIADTYKNNLIFLGTENDLNRIIEFVQNELDRPLESQESRLHIKELKYTYAEKIKPILDAVIKPAAKDAKSPLVGQVKYFEDMVIAAETAQEAKDDKTISTGSGNRLIIACNKDDWNRIERFIDKLDKPQPQVAMEILFVDVTLTDNNELGAQLNNKKAGMLGVGINAETQHLEQLTPNPGHQNIMGIFNNKDTSGNLVEINASAAFVSAGKVGSIWAVAKSVLQTDNINILSQPYLVANNHQKCTLEVANKRNLADQIDPNSTTAVQTFKDITAKTQVEITPNINSDGVVTLNIIIKIDEFSGVFSTNTNPTSGNQTNRHLQTSATLMDGEVLVLGGLIRTKVSDTIYKTPILSSIPILGNLFKHRIQSIIKEDLHIFIRPTLIKPRFEGAPEDYTQLKLDYAKIQIGRNADFLSTTDPIQRWFFGTQKKADDFKQIDNFTEGKDQPRSVIIPIDPYYKTESSRTIHRYEDRRKKVLKKQEAIPMAISP